MVLADRRLWLTADKSRLVEDGDPDAAFLFAGAGCEVDDDEAARVGYPGAKQSAPAEDKAQPAPENKASGLTVNRRKAKE